MITNRFERRILNNSEFSLYSQNLLAGCWSTDLNEYSYVEEPKEEHLDWSGRARKLMRDFKIHQPDVLCLQEVETACFENDILKPLQNIDESYRGVLKKTLGDFPVGVGCVYKESVFELVQVYETSCSIILVLKFKSNSSLVYVTSCHLFGDPKQPQTRINQLKSIFKNVKKYQKGNNHPMIICGDFNTEPNSATYNFVADSKLKSKSEENDVVVTEVDIQHPFKLKSAYKEIIGNEPEFTFRPIEVALTCDYIFYSYESLKIDGIMSLNEQDSAIIHQTGIPNSKYGSDHLGLQAYFKFVTL